MEETKQLENQNSVKLSINAKGLFSGEVKVYASTSELALAKCVEIASKVEALIKQKNQL